MSIVIAIKVPQVSDIISAFIPSLGKTKTGQALLKRRPTKQQPQPQLGPLSNQLIIALTAFKSPGLFAVGREHICGKKKKPRCRA